MKRLFGILFLLVMVIAATTVASAGDYYWDEVGFVQSNNVSIRAEPDTRSDKLFTGKNSEELVIIGKEGSWYIVDCRLSGLCEQELIGYVRSQYIETGAYKIKLTKSVNLYRDPWSGKWNGERVAGNIITVLYDYDGWLVIQTNEGKAGSSFVKKSDVHYEYEDEYDEYERQGASYDPFSDPTSYPKGMKGVYGPNTNTDYEAEWYIPQKWSVGIREYPNKDLECMVILHQGDSVHVIHNLGRFAYVRYDDPKRDNGYIEGYVDTQYWAAY